MISRRPAACTAGTLALALALAAVVAPGRLTAASAEVLARQKADQTGTAITVIFDDSGSMRGNKLSQAKQAFGWWLASMPDGLVWSLIHFGEGGRILVPFTREDGRNRLAAAVRQLRAENNTPIAASLELAARQIEERRSTHSPYERHIILLFTDGAENVHQRGNRAVIDRIRQLRARQIEVVGIGYAGEGEYLAGSVTRYARAADEAELRRGLGEVASEIDANSEVRLSPADLDALAAPEAGPPPAAPAALAPARQGGARSNAPAAPPASGLASANPSPPAAPAPTAAAAPAPTPAAAPSADRGSGVPWWVGLFGVILAFQFLKRLIRGSRRR